MKSGRYGHFSLPTKERGKCLSDFILTQFSFALPFTYRGESCQSPVRSIEATVEKYLRNCIRAYFEGRTLRWIVAGIDGAVDGRAKAQARIVVETRFGQYASTRAYRDLVA